MENYTTLAQQAIQQASEIAIKRDAPELTSWILLEALLKQSGSPVKSLVKSIMTTGDYTGLIDEITQKNESGPKISGTTDFQVSRSLQVLLVKADTIKDQLKASAVDTTHLLIALVKYDNSIAEFLKGYTITESTLVAQLTSKKTSTNGSGDRSDHSDLIDILAEFAIDITAQAESGELDPIIGRDEEIRRMMQILSRRTKNNPVLVGDPGVGKTALVEGLAQLIVKNDVPDTLQDKKIFELRIGDLMSGTQYRGAFEEKIKKILDTIDKLDGEVILFIDELHTIVGAGKTEGSADLGNMLKPALARGRLRVIGATTLSEYRQYIEKDAALERRFQPVMVDEPARDDAIAILRGIKPNYERFHGVKIADDALIAAVDLSSKYIADRFLPDKAIDLMDEATAAVKMNLVSQPEQITELKRQIHNFEVERQALENELKDKKNEKKSVRLDEISSKLTNLKESYQALKSERDSERKLLIQVKNIKDEMAQIQHDIDRATQSGDYNRSAELQYSTLPKLQTQLHEIEQQIERDRQSGDLAINDMVGVEDIAQVIARWTGIPATKLVEKDIDKLQNIDQWLSDRVLGQYEAVEAVSNAIRRSRAGLQDPNRPTGSFIFAGPTGVGKTELAKSLAEYLFNDPDAMIRIDMSEYMEKHTVSRLIGSPPGYIGHEEGGQLTEAVRRKPYSVLLFDEIEKAHPDVFNVFLQILDDGRLTDSKGRTVSFNNTIIIMTTNLGSQKIMETLKDHDKLSATEYEGTKSKLESELLEDYAQHFRPEFLNRVDDVILFNPISQTTLRAIVDVQLGNIIALVKREKDIDLSFSDKAKDELGILGYDPVFGARPLKRVIQSRILDLLASSIISGAITESSQVEIEWDGERFVIG